MSDRNTEDIIGALYDLVQDARSMPLAADKCILERDRVLDMLDEIIAQLPHELKQSRTIVESRNELISQARREGREYHPSGPGAGEADGHQGGHLCGGQKAFGRTGRSDPKPD